MTTIKEIFRLEKNPKKGLYPVEWATIIYLAFTFLWVLFAYTKMENPHSMIWMRVRILITTFALWTVYRLLPCRFMEIVRVLVQMLFLAQWYPDTYELNRVLPNLDYLFAEWEQIVFGFQPALVFAKHLPWMVVSELMHFGYFMYYPLIVAVCIYYFLADYKEFERCCFIVITAFFIYYIVFDFLPVAGPTFYYNVIGEDTIAKGIFPKLGNYFNTHTDCLPSPGNPNGFFYHLVEDARAQGERPTAAFPSSHVGIATICMMLILHLKNSKFFWWVFPVYAFLCMGTVYIQAHYMIDAIAGFITGMILYFVLLLLTRHMIAANAEC
ncbi:MAG: phosphatase PAP2 family protein [Prevotella sp.]|jgi:membrane-associated phospholipid phosphatase|uniref:Phosphatase PAP2 family protein n=1 Tax=Segatella cerevisiae TaxID=2053716 RepID=A0ABT1BX14_9BACT|nr:phosphatase PAP2 family protein [Segatella cerevisiae]MCH3994785.1 phosphatase PAP2 family protein [Prevotella sp.]MCI1247115.1 phosphatase PAP2 family protein [Prevotella sp.]MCO6025619.1 phosphatase PAP2 family protein [Segatella cerevisiae]